VIATQDRWYVGSDERITRSISKSATARRAAINHRNRDRPFCEEEIVINHSHASTEQFDLLPTQPAAFHLT
jgi:hypothetical protein